MDRILSSLRPTLMDRYLLRTLARPGLATLGVTLVMMLLERAIRLINEIAGAGAEVIYFFPLIASEIPYYIGLGLPAAFFIAMFMVIIRMDEGNELEAMLASGRSLFRITLPLIGVGVGLGLISILVFGFLQPYGRYNFRVVENKAIRAGWSGELRAGSFVTPDASTTLSADHSDAVGRHVKGIFLSRMAPDGRETIVTGASGRLTVARDGKTVRMALDSGREAEEQADGKVQVLQFENIILDAPRGGSQILTPRGMDARELTIDELVKERLKPHPSLPLVALDAELYARLGRALSLPLLPLLAFPLGVATKRGRRGPGLMFAAIVLVLFHHGVQLIGSLAALGKIDPLLGIGGLFAGFCLFTVWLFVSSLKRPGQTPLTPVFELITIGIEVVARWIARIRVLWRRSGPPRASASKGGLRGYVGRLLLARTGAAAVVIVALLQIIELLERTGDILARGVGLPGLGYYALLQLPGMIQQAVGFAMFAGAVLTFMELGRSGEMIAMRAAGISLRQLLGMLLPVALIVGGVDLVIGYGVTPGTERALGEWMTATAPAGERAAAKPHWFRAGGDLVRVQQASDSGDALYGVRIYRRDRDTAIVQRITAASAVKGPQGWSLNDAHLLNVTAVDASRAAAPKLAWNSPLKAVEVVELFHPTMEISVVAAVRALTGGAVNQNAGYFLTHLHRLLAEPLAPIVMLLLAAPLALSHGRNARNLGLLLYGIGGGMAYLVADGLLTVSGETGALPAILAAWAAPLGFAAAAFTVLLYAEA